MTTTDFTAITTAITNAGQKSRDEYLASRKDTIDDYEPYCIRTSDGTIFERIIKGSVSTSAPANIVSFKTFLRREAAASVGSAEISAIHLVHYVDPANIVEVEATELVSAG